MTSILSKISPKSPFGINFINNLKANKKLFIIITIMHMISLPVLLPLMVIDDFGEIPSMYAFIAAFCTAIAGSLGIVVAINSFNYLYKKSNVDMVYALPISIKQRFLSNFLSGLMVYTLPYIAAMLISLLIHIGAGLLVNSWNEYLVNYTDDLLMLMTTGFIVMLFLYVVSVFVLTCCGTLFESIAYIFIVNAIIPASITVFFYVIIQELYGLDI